MHAYEEMEKEICTLLKKHANDWYAAVTLAPNIAKTSLKMNHLYEDLGFESRTQMGRFMKDNFSSLADLKPKDVLWKKFLFDSIGKVAPACADCCDSVSCFKCMLAEASA